MDNKKKYQFLSVFGPSLLVVAFVAGVLAALAVVGFFSESGLGPVEEAYRFIRLRYDGEREPEKLRESAIRGMVGTLDDYSEYFTPEEYQRFMVEAVSGAFGGIGVVFEPDEASGYVLIVLVLPDTPAMEAGVKPGDLVLSADGVDFLNKETDEIVGAVRGKPGSVVRLKIRREGKEPFDVPVKRKIISVPAVEGRMIDRKAGIGYLRVISFTRQTADFRKEYEKLKKEGLRALVIDLRYNGGGLLDACVEMSDLFLESGVIVSTRYADGSKEVYEAKADEQDIKLPLAVLVNRRSASASEIFAGAMQDHKRAVLLGERTYGKGTVQSSYELKDGSCLKITTARYFTPSGICIQRQEGKKDYGIKPDLLLEATSEEFLEIARLMSESRYGRTPEKTMEDFQLEGALEVLRAKLEGRKPEVKERIVPEEPPQEKQEKTED